MNKLIVLFCGLFIFSCSKNEQETKLQEKIYSKFLDVSDKLGNTVSLEISSNHVEILNYISSNDFNIEVNAAKDSKSNFIVEDSNEKVINSEIENDFVTIRISNLSSPKEINSLKVTIKLNKNELEQRWRETLISWILISGVRNAASGINVYDYQEDDNSCSEDYEIRRHKINLSTGAETTSPVQVVRSKFHNDGDAFGTYNLNATLISQGWNGLSYRWDEDGWGCDVDEVSRTVVFYY
jgi:hypothetical protein